MRQPFHAENRTNGLTGLPAGGYVRAVGLRINWQAGPLRGERGGHENGASVETVIAAAMQRIEWYQTVADGRFSCAENAEAIAHLASALDALERRTARRTDAGVEGTHEPAPGDAGYGEEG